MNKVSHKIVLKFPHRLVNQPIVYKLVKDYNLEFNILKAYVTPDEEGHLVLALTGEVKHYDDAVKYLKGLGVKVDPLSRDIVWNDKRCTHCSACIGICPTGAFTVDEKTRKISFNEEKCIACLLCIPACPVRAIDEHF